MRIPPGTSSARGTYLKWLRRIAASVAVLLVLALGAAVLNNNVSIQRPSRAQFVGNLDRTLARSTDWVLEELYSIVNARYEDSRSIVITTNLDDRKALQEQIGERTVSRLTEMCKELPVLGHDRRMDMRAV